MEFNLHLDIDGLKTAPAGQGKSLDRHMCKELRNERPLHGPLKATALGPFRLFVLGIMAGRASEAPQASQVIIYLHSSSQQLLLPKPPHQSDIPPHKRWINSPEAGKKDGGQALRQ